MEAPCSNKKKNRMEVTEVFLISVTVLGYHLSNSLAIQGDEFLKTGYNQIITL